MTDFNCDISTLEESITSLSSRCSALKTQLREATEFTEKFLDECSKVGITKVSIGKRHESVPSSVHWPFGHDRSVFAFQPKGAREQSGWPPIWGVVERMGISYGCGNSDQHQADTSNLIDGVYHLRQGRWIRVDNNEE